MRDYGLRISDADLRILFNAYDTNGSGALEFDEFKNGIRGELSPQRSKLIRYAFQKMNRTGSPKLSLTDIAEVYNPALNADVLRGRKTARDAVTELLNAFDNEVCI